MFCIACGTKAPEGAFHCYKCGKPLYTQRSADMEVTVGSTLVPGQAQLAHAAEGQPGGNTRLRDWIACCCFFGTAFVLNNVVQRAYPPFTVDAMASAVGYIVAMLLLPRLIVLGVYWKKNVTRARTWAVVGLFALILNVLTLLGNPR